VKLVPNFDPEDFVGVVAADVEFVLLLNDPLRGGLQLNGLNQVAAESIPDTQEKNLCIMREILNLI